MCFGSLQVYAHQFDAGSNQLNNIGNVLNRYNPIMKPKEIRHRLAVYFLVIASLISGLYSFFINPPKLLVANDGAAQWETRMISVREHLPASVHEVGYISNSENPGSTIEEYLLTKYALIPVTVREGTNYEWVIGNFTQPGFQKILDAQIPAGYTLEKLGSGIYLIHRSRP